MSCLVSLPVCPAPVLSHMLPIVQPTCFPSPLINPCSSLCRCQFVVLHSPRSSLLVSLFIVIVLLFFDLACFLDLVFCLSFWILLPVGLPTCLPVANVEPTQPLSVPVTAAESTQPLQVPVAAAEWTLPLQVPDAAARLMPPLQVPVAAAGSTQPIPVPVAAATMQPPVPVAAESMQCFQVPAIA